MSYIAKNITGHDERIIFMAHLHWFYILSGFFWMLLLMLAGLYLNQELWSHFVFRPPRGSYEPFEIPVLAKYYCVFITFAAAGITVFLVHLIKHFTTEIALTPQRVIYKKGWLMIEVEEIEVSEIRAEQIHQSIIGRLLKYGTLHMDSRFVGDVYIPAINRPYKLLHAIHKARKKVKDPLEE